MANSSVKRGRRRRPSPRGRAAAPPTRRRRRWPLLAAGVVLLAIVVVVAALVVGDGDGGSRAEVPAERPVAAYKVVYRVTELGQKREETVVVRRPYDSRRSSTRDAEVFSGTLVNANGLWQFGGEPSPAWQLLDPGRRRAEADERPLAALRVLFDEGLAEPRPEGLVANRPCTSFRVREPIGSVATQAPTGRDHVELCVDRTGVVLQERWVSNGRLVRSRKAVLFDPSPSLGGDAFEPVPEAKGADSGPAGGRRQFPFTDEIDANLEIGFDLPSSVKADGGTAILTVDPSGQPIGGTAFRFFRHGDDVIDVEEVETEADDAERAIPYDVPVGRGFVETDLRTVTLKVLLPSGTTVVMRGPSLDLLDVMADAMQVRSESDDNSIG